MVKKSVKVTNESGLHARPASVLVEEAVNTLVNLVKSGFRE